MATRKIRTRGRSALTTHLDDKAQTIVYVHGIGNKPPASVLQGQWDHALFGFDLGARSRLAYWVNREYYPLPTHATCGTGVSRVTPTCVVRSSRPWTCEVRLSSSAASRPTSRGRPTQRAAGATAARCARPG